jgi:hypothetical protein
MEDKKTDSAPLHKKKWGSVYGFLRSPLDGKYPLPMRNAGDWIAALGVALFVVAVFALPWIKLSVSAFGSSLHSQEFGLFVSPWAWGMVALLVIMAAGLWFTQARGAVILGAGVCCVIFSIIFYVGAWQKVNAIIGDIVGLARSVPLIGQLLGTVITEITKRILHVGLSSGYYLSIAAGIILIVGGAIRLSASVGSE